MTTSAFLTPSRLRRALMLAMASALPSLLAPSGRAETWTPTTAGTRDWNDAGNWGGVSFPNSTGGVANISADFTGDQIINLNQTITVGSLTINDSGSGTDNTVTIAAGTAGSLGFAPSSGSATITNSSGGVTNTISADINFGANNVTINQGSAGSSSTTTKLTLSGAIGGSGIVTVTGTSTNGGKALLELSNAGSTFTGSWVLNGSSANITSYDQGGAGILVSNDAALGAIPSTAGTQITVQTTSAIQVAGGVTLHANRGIAVDPGATLILIATTSVSASKVAGSITGSGNLLINSGTNRVMELSGTNTYTGATTVRSGTLRAGSVNAFGTDSAMSVTGTLSLNGFSNTIGSLSGTGGVTLGSATLTTGTKNTDTTYAGIISGTGGFTKTGTGVQTLAGVNTYTGATTVNNGTLSVTGSLAAGSAVGVSSGATLRGTGTIGGATTLNNGATLAAGVDAATLGTLTFGGTLTSVSGATFSLKLNSTTSVADQIAANGVTLNGATLSLTDLGGVALAEGTTFTLLNNTSGGGIVGTFAGLAESSAITVGLNTYIISYVGGTGNDVTLTTSAVPEPSAYAVLLGGMSVVFAGFVRSRRARR